MLASDRDLLMFEPNLFRDVSWVGQRLVKATGTIAGTTLTISAFDVSFDGANIGPGHILVCDGAPYEVIAKLSATTATVSRLRASLADPVQPPSPATGVPTFVPTMNLQLAIVEQQVLRMAGIEPGSAEPPNEASIVNVEALRRLVSLGALHLVYAAAGAPGDPGAIGANGSPLSRAEYYQRRFADERSRVVVELDLDGDGKTDATRRLFVAQVVRL